MKNKKKLKTVFIVAGSSGGHSLPGVAIIEALSELSPELNIIFIHSGKNHPQEYLNKFKYPIYQMSIGGLASGQSLFKRLKTFFQIFYVSIFSFYLFIRYRPQLVFGTGGSLTGPVLLIGKLFFCRLGIWEGNAIVGLANRLLTPFVDKVFTFFDKVPHISERKNILCQYPFRSSFKNYMDYSKDSHFKSLDKKLKILILGGSQGSALLNRIVSKSILNNPSLFQNILVIHQTGAKDFQEIKESYSILEENTVEVFDFSHQIQDYYKKADVIFSRAGAGALAEISLFQKHLVLIPITKSGGGHQLKNAMYFYNKKLVDLILEKNFTENTFLKKIKSFKDISELSLFSTKHKGKKSGSLIIAEWICQELVT